jgi:hypothetical protein
MTSGVRLMCDTFFAKNASVIRIIRVYVICMIRMLAYCTNRLGAGITFFIIQLLTPHSSLLTPHSSPPAGVPSFNIFQFPPILASHNSHLLFKYHINIFIMN